MDTNPDQSTLAASDDRAVHNPVKLEDDLSAKIKSEPGTNSSEEQQDRSLTGLLPHLSTSSSSDVNSIDPLMDPVGFVANLVQSSRGRPDASTPFSLVSPASSSTHVGPVNTAHPSALEPTPTSSTDISPIITPSIKVEPGTELPMQTAPQSGDAPPSTQSTMVHPTSPAPTSGRVSPAPVPTPATAITLVPTIAEEHHDEEVEDEVDVASEHYTTPAPSATTGGADSSGDRTAAADVLSPPPTSSLLLLDDNERHDIGSEYTCHDNSGAVHSPPSALPPTIDDEDEEDKEEQEEQEQEDDDDGSGSEYSSFSGSGGGTPTMDEANDLGNHADLVLPNVCRKLSQVTPGSPDP